MNRNRWSPLCLLLVFGLSSSRAIAGRVEASAAPALSNAQPARSSPALPPRPVPSAPAGPTAPLRRLAPVLAPPAPTTSADSDRRSSPLPPFRPEGTSSSELFQQATTATQQGAFSRAILLFEQLSDRDFSNANASFNRAVAYLQRADSGKRRNGDLGQAAAALREAQLLGDDGDEVRRLLVEVRRAISRRRARRGKDPVVVSPSLGYGFSTLVPHNVWAGGALVGSLLLTLGTVMLTSARRASAETQIRLSAQLLSVGGLGLLLLCAGLFLAASHFSAGVQEAVVVNDEAQLLDSEGKALSAKALDVEARAVPEGADVLVIGSQGRVLDIRWGNVAGHVRTGEVRLLSSTKKAE